MKQLLVLVLLLAALPVAFAALEDNLVLVYTFDEGGLSNLTGSADMVTPEASSDASNDEPFTVESDKGYREDAMSGNGYEDSADLGLNLGSSHTIVFLVNESSGTSSSGALFSDGGRYYGIATRGVLDYCTPTQQSNHDFTLYTYSGGTYCYQDTDDDVVYNALYHVAVTYDSGTVKLYVDGSLLQTATAGDVDEPIQFGAHKSNQNTAVGYYDEIYGWNRVLSGTEISNLYNSGDYLIYNDDDEEFQSFPFDSPPTDPSSLTLTNPLYVTNTLTASCSGSTDPDGGGVTYYYRFYNDDDAAERQAYSTDNTYVVQTSDTHDTLRVFCYASDGALNSSTINTTRAVSNTLPTTPSGSSLNAADEYDEILEATGAGSTDTDTDSITYWYEFRCDAEDGALEQTKSTDNTYNITTNCGSSVYVNIWANDSYSESSSYETLSRNLLVSGIVTSNLSGDSQTRENITANVTYTNIFNSVTCGIYENSSTVSCGTDTSALVNDSMILECGISGDVAEWISFVPYCTNGTEKNATAKLILVDNINPLVTPSFANESVYYKANVTGQFNFSDPHLYSWNVSIDGIEVDSATNVVYTSYIYNLSYDPSGLAAGEHTLTLEVADGHTAREIQEYKVKNGLFNNYLELDTDKNRIKIQGENPSMFDDFQARKEKDRYKFTYKAAAKASDNLHTFLVETDKPLTIVNRPESKWRQWIVSGDNWIDFYSEQADLSKLRITKIDDYTARVVVYSAAQTIEFQSVGELNIVTRNFTFYTLNASAQYAESVLEGQETTINLTVDLGGSSYTASDVNASLAYNGTLYSATKSSGGGYVYFTSDVTAPSVASTQNASFTWNVSVIGESPTLSSFNQTVFYIGVADCTDQPTWTTALNITVLDEEALAIVAENTSVDATIEILDGSSILDTFNLELRNSNNYSLCIENAAANYTTDLTLEVYNENTTKRSYSWEDYALDNSTDMIYVYILLEDDAINAIFTYQDETTTEALDNVLVSMSRLINGSWVAVESRTTDITGRAQFSFIENEKYRFSSTKTGYEDKTFILNPIIFTAYTVKMVPETTVEDSLQYLGIVISYSPKTFVFNDTGTFFFTINSPGAVLQNYSLNITYGSQEDIYTGSNSIGETFSHSYTLDNETAQYFIVTYEYYSTLSGHKSFSYPYRISNLSTGNTIEAMRENGYGIGIFERVVISVLVAIVVAGIASYVAGFTAGGAIGLLVMGVFAYAGFMPWWAAFLSFIVGFFILIRGAGG